jgi:prolipoprotein diacylglyceryltransferase
VVFEATMKLNMGQWLSIPFIVMGVVGLYLSLKYKKRAIII